MHLYRISISTEKGKNVVFYVILFTICPHVGRKPRREPIILPTCVIGTNNPSLMSAL